MSFEYKNKIISDHLFTIAEDMDFIDSPLTVKDANKFIQRLYEVMRKISDYSEGKDVE